MTRRRQKYRRQYKPVLEPKKPVEPIVKPMTLWQALCWLFRVMWVKITPSKYLNKHVFYKKKWHKILGETADYFFIAAEPGKAFPKKDNKLLIR